MQGITPFLWFDHQAEEAANFYVSLFKHSKIETKSYYNEEIAEAAGRPAGSLMAVDFQLEGQHFVALNGNEDSSFSPGVSFFVNCETPQELDQLWEKLSAGGKVLMPLGQYPFSEKYGWLQDQYGVNWQLILGKQAQKITPCLLFVGDQAGKAEAAITLYTSIFPNSGVISLTRYAADAGVDAGRIQHSRFSLCGQDFVAMDSGMPEHGFTFTRATSFMVNCDNQPEVDHCWEALTTNGKALYCGWLIDPYGLTWQITPVLLNALRKDADPEKSRRAMSAMMQMVKLDIAALQRAVEASPAS